jgi:carboxylesterase type B
MDYGRRRQRAYFNRFAYVPESWRARLPGVVHSGELIFVFDCVPRWSVKATAAGSRHGKTVSGYWVDFIKTGDPNGGGRPEWKPYDPSTRDVMNFTDAGRYGADPKQRLDLWWKSGPGALRLTPCPAGKTVRTSAHRRCAHAFADSFPHELDQRDVRLAPR